MEKILNTMVYHGILWSSMGTIAAMKLRLGKYFPDFNSLWLISG
jgi:hypothetical protein